MGGYKCVHYKAYFNVLFGSKYIINENGSFFRCCKICCRPTVTAQYWNFLNKIKKKITAHEELVFFKLQLNVLRNIGI